jgi:CDP-diglyceride synthetase
MGQRRPTGDKGFKGAVIGCGVLVAAGLAMVLLTHTDVQAVGASFIALGALGLVTAAAGLLAERIVERRRRRWPEGHSGNGSRPDRHYRAGA